MKIRIPPDAWRLTSPILHACLERGWDIYVVGGPARDWVLRQPSKDIDLLLPIDPGPLARWCQKRWGGVLEEFGQFGTMRLSGAEGGLRLDFARARTETYPEPADLPVVRPGTVLEDLFRRDFTINAIAAKPLEDGSAELVDPHGGLEDLERGVLRVLHSASFRDDPTRLFRAARFSVRLGFGLEKETDRRRREAMGERWLDRLSRERLRGELIRILEEKDPVPALKRIGDWDLARYLHADLAWPARFETMDMHERLGVMALKMGDEGADFLRSLHLERPVSLALLEACRIWKEQSCARSPLASLTAGVLKAHAATKKDGERLSPAALWPLWITGEDLKEHGLAAGPAFRQLLEHAARAQWRGEFSTRAQALAWLKRSI